MAVLMIFQPLESLQQPRKPAVSFVVSDGSGQGFALADKDGHIHIHKQELFRFIVEPFDQQSAMVIVHRL